MLSFKTTYQETNQPMENRDILRFCALTPYEHTKALCKTCKRAKSGVLWVQLYLDSTLVGLAQCQYARNGRLCILQHFIISPTHRRNGLGNRLLQYIMHQGVPIMVSVDRKVPYVVEFYRKRGFEPVLELMPSLLSTAPIPREEAFIIAIQYGM